MNRYCHTLAAASIFIPINMAMLKGAW